MATTRSDLHILVDRLPEDEILVAERFLQFLTFEPVGPLFSESIRRGMAQADAGQSIVCRDEPEMISKILKDSVT